MSEKSINWERSIELNPGFSVDELKAWFDKYPRSGKRVIAVCQGCDCKDRERDVSFRDYRDLCMSCATKKCFEDPKEREKTSIAGKKRFEDPKERERQSIGGKKRWEDPEGRKKQSITQKKRYAEMDDPGLEICNHHYLYDHSDLCLNTVKITRRDHMRLHALLRKLGYKVPHINIKEVING